MIEASSVFISPSILGFFTGNIAFNEVKVTEPKITYEISAPAPAPVTAESTAGTAQSIPLAQTIQKEKPAVTQRPLRLILKRVIIKNGRINFIDYSVGENGIKLTVKDIDFNLTNLYLLPRSVITNFELKGKIPWQEGQAEGKIEAEGWMNLFKKDIQATLKIQDIDGIYLYPYYSNWVDLEKARIEKAKMNFSSEIQGLNNNVTAQCHLELTDIVRRPRPPEETQEKAEKITDAVLGIFKALNQGKIVLDFTIRTKMDQPVFNFGNIKMAFEDKLAQARKGEVFNAQEVFLFPTRLLEGAVKGMTNLSRAIVDGVFNVGLQVKKSVEDTFKKEKQE
jgi:hypothetical protein